MITAQEILQFARDNNIRVRRMGCSTGVSGHESYCAIGVLGLMGGVEYPRDGVPALNMDRRDVDALENGFEGFEHRANLNPYYEIGRELYKLLYRGFETWDSDYASNSLGSFRFES